MADDFDFSPDRLRWMKLSELREGAVFTTESGVKAVKSEYHHPNNQCQCVLLESGEYWQAPNGNDTMVLEHIIYPDPPIPWWWDECQGAVRNGLASGFQKVEALVDSLELILGCDADHPEYSDEKLFNSLQRVLGKLLEAESHLRPILALIYEAREREDG